MNYIKNNEIAEKLEAPVVYRVDGDDKHIYWNRVKGANSYTVTINPGSYNISILDVGNDIVECYIGDYFMENDHNGSLSITVKALGAQSDIYLDSDISNVLIFELSVLPSMEKYYYNNGLLDTINILSGKSFTDVSENFNSIFDERLLSGLTLKETILNEQNAESIESSDIVDYYNKLNTAAAYKVKGSVGAQLTSSIKLGIENEFNIDVKYGKTSKDKTAEKYYTYKHKVAGTQVEIKNVNDNKIFYSILSSAFLNDINKVANRAMTPEVFISKYGTHVITSAIYGAMIEASYDEVCNSGSTTNDLTFGADLKFGIDVSLGNIGQAESNTQLNANIEKYTNKNTESTYKKFTVNAKGGKAGNFVDYASFVNNYGAWVETITKENYSLIDLPDESLICIWDLLGDEYAQAKNILNDYVKENCNDINNDKIKNLKSLVYSDYVHFDEETQTLEFNFTGLQAYQDNSIQTIDLASTIKYNDFYNNGVFTITPGYNGKQIKKIVFKGNYLQKDANLVQVKSKFTNFAIKFHSDWDEDVIIEFIDFAYSAPNGKVSLDLSEISSKNVQIIVTNNVEIRGGNAQSTSQNGFEAIVSASENLTFIGDNLTVYGGNGATATTDGGNGSNGGTAIIANNISINMDTGTLTVYGGNGGNGATGSKGKNGSDNDEPGSNGGNGGNGGNGASAIKCESITATETSTATLIAGNGGSGGAGGRGGDGADDDAPASLKNGKGGNGGNGGNGGSCSSALVTNDSAETSLIVLIDGTVGAGGVGGNGGDGGDTTGWFGGDGSDGGKGGTGGLYGDGVTRAANGTAGKQGA